MSSERLSSLEQVFDFRNEAFSQYMNYGGGKQVSVVDLEHMASRMIDDDHPIVRYAAGCALAEVAMKRQRRMSGSQLLDNPLENRLVALGLAEKTWQGIADDFSDLSIDARNVQNERRAADYWALGVRRDLALAHLSSMHILAHWMADETLPSDAVAEGLADTRAKLCDIGWGLLAMQGDTRRMRAQCAGIANETIAELVMQEVESPKGIIVPATIRQDNSVRHETRADLVAVSVGKRHPKTLIQVGAADKKTTREGYMLFIRDTELRFTGQAAAMTSLRAVLEYELRPESNVLTGEQIAWKRTQLQGRLNRVHRHDPGLEPQPVTELVLPAVVGVDDGLGDGILTFGGRV